LINQFVEQGMTVLWLWLWKTGAFVMSLSPKQLKFMAADRHKCFLANDVQDFHMLIYDYGYDYGRPAQTLVGKYNACDVIANTIVAPKVTQMLEDRGIDHDR
jgi:hypothetical protein